MDAIRTDNYGGIPELLESMHTSISMLEAFGAMLGYTLGSGDGVPDISWGAENIIRQHCQDFEFIRTAMRSQFEALRDGNIRVKDIDEVAKIVALSPDKVAQVLQFATGIDATRKGAAAMSDALTQKHFGIIRVAKTQLGMTEDDYRALLRSITGQESAKALTPKTFKVLMDRFELMGFRSTAVKKDATRHPGKATEAQRRKVRALWAEFTDGEGTDASLRHWMEKRGYGSSPEFLDGKDATRIIGALTNMVARRS